MFGVPIIRTFHKLEWIRYIQKGLNSWLYLSCLSQFVSAITSRHLLGWTVPHEALVIVTPRKHVESVTGTAVLSTLMLTAGWNFLWEKTTTLGLLAFRRRPASILFTSDWKTSDVKGGNGSIYRTVLSAYNVKVVFWDRGILVREIRWIRGPE